MIIKNRGEKYSISYGQKNIEFELFFCNRKTMEVAVHPDCEITIKAPLGTDMEIINRKVLKRARWIIKQIDYFSQFIPRTPARSYVSGETHLYLGKQYRLKLFQGKYDEVKLFRGYFNVSYKDIITPEKVKKLLEDWYITKAQMHFSKSFDNVWDKFVKFDLTKPSFVIKRMQKRWGSLSKNGKITLNLDLIKAPKECIDYVIIHELCHLKYHNHSSDFYKLLDSFNPDWKKAKHKLEFSLI